MRYTKVKTEQDVQYWYWYLIKNNMDDNISSSCYGYNIAMGNTCMDRMIDYGDFYMDEDGYFLIDERLYFCCLHGEEDEKINAFTDYLPLYGVNRYNL